MSRLDLAVEQKVLRALKPLREKLPSGILLALSGGVDSMVMAEFLWKWRRGLGLDLGAAYVHHGPTKDRRQRHYRDEAQEFVKEWALARGIRFFTNSKAPQLKTETEYREFREEKVRAWSKKGGF